MPIDPRIALGVQAPQIESPMNVMANALKLRSMQNENALFEQQQRQAAMQAEEQNRLRSLLAGNASPEQLMRAGFFEQGAELGKFGRDQSAETRAQAEEARKTAEVTERRRKGAIGMVTVAMENPHLYEQMLELASNTYGPESIQGLSPTFPGRQPLAAFRDSMLTPQERAEMAARERTASIQEGQLRVSQGQLGVSQGQLDVSRGRLELERDKEAREAAAPPKGADLPSGYEIGPDGRMRPIPGGPADPDTIAAKKRAEAAPATEARAKAAQQGVNTVNASLLELRSAYESLKNKGAIPSEALASMGPSGIAANLGAYAAASERGQAVGRAFGSEAQGDRDVIRAANMRLASAIARATGQTSQQLNSNVELQLALKSLGDPQSSYESNMRILDYLDRFVRENYAGDATGAATSGASGVTSSGTRYTREE